MEDRLDQSFVTEMENVAVEMAREAGRILRGHFGRPLEVEYKSDGKRDPVSRADLESQEYLSQVISQRYPDHGIVAEEGPEEDDGPAPDFLWVLDPLDGTSNFVNGLPMYAVSIGVLHRGIPLVGALYIPWPGEAAGSVLHARKGGGAWLDREPLSIPQSDAPEASRLASLPASFGALFRFRKGMRAHLGEVRVTGSIAYELALTVCGAFQYVIIGGPKIWDVAGGALIVVESGGAVLVRNRMARSWEPMSYLGPSWDGGPPSLKKIRNRVGPLIAGNPKVASFVAANLKDRFSLSARASRLLAKLRGGKR